MSPFLEDGTLLRNRYRIVERVGHGGMGAVYKAEDTRLPGRVTAVKQILPDPNATAQMDADAQEQFRLEASTLARLDHPGLTKVSDYFVEGGADYLVMDYVDGPDLRQIVDETRAVGELLPADQVVGWMKQLLEIVAYLHGQDPPVLHRDIKPSNIKLTEDGRIKLVDFGLVKPLDPTDPRTLTVARGVGSLPYTPLEQYPGDNAHTGTRSDLYSVGATLYHLVTGRTPATAQERFLSPGAFIRPRRINPNLSDRLEATILAAMALHPERRPENATTLAALLSGEADVQADPELETASLAWRAGAWENVGLFILVLLLLILATLATWRAQPTVPTEGQTGTIRPLLILQSGCRPTGPSGGTVAISA